MSTSKTELTIPVFEGTNFPQWRFRTETILDAKDLSDILENILPTKVQSKEWILVKKRAKMIIIKMSCVIRNLSMLVRSTIFEKYNGRIRKDVRVQWVHDQVTSKRKLSTSHLRVEVQR